MKRDIIIIEDKAVSVTGNEIWMTAGEIAGCSTRVSRQ